jgi:plastocyanin
MRRSIASAFALFVLLAAGACGGSPASAPPLAQPTPSPAPSIEAAACHTPATNEPLTTPVAVAIADRSYDPDPVRAKVGEAIQWTNEDSVPHTATLHGVDCDTGQLSRGQQGVLVFTEAGTYDYRCRVHSSMHGTITITP